MTVNEEVVGAIAGKWAMVGGIEDDRAMDAIHGAVREALAFGSVQTAAEPSIAPVPPGDESFASAKKSEPAPAPAAATPVPLPRWQEELEAQGYERCDTGTATVVHSRQPESLPPKIVRLLDAYAAACIGFDTRQSGAPNTAASVARIALVAALRKALGAPAAATGPTPPDPLARAEELLAFHEGSAVPLRPRSVVGAYPVVVVNGEDFAEILAGVRAGLVAVTARVAAPLLAAEINALPGRVRAYIHDIEANADPAGTIASLAAQQENVAGLAALLEESRAESSRLRSEVAALRAQVEGAGKLRPEVLAFARVMSAKIDGHNHDRGEHGWRTARPIDLLDWLHRYFGDLQDAVRAFDFRGERTAPVLSKAANVANLAMMIADVCGGLAAHDAAKGGERHV